VRRTKKPESFNPEKYGMIFPPIVAGLVGPLLMLRESMCIKCVDGSD